MDLFIINVIDGLIYGLLLFMLSSGLTLIFSMMGVLNLSHAAFYMLGAYLAYQISIITGFWVGLIVAPVLVTILGAAVEIWLEESAPVWTCTRTDIHFWVIFCDRRASPVYLGKKYG